MTQLILHLVGDYITQSHWMAVNKTKSTWAAFCHATVYSLPFLCIGSKEAVFVIWLSHLLIDRFRLARFVVFAKNHLFGPQPYLLLWSGILTIWNDCKETGYHKDVPPWLAVWLMIVADNTLHLACNFLALKFL